MIIFCYQNAHECVNVCVGLRACIYYNKVILGQCGAMIILCKSHYATEVHTSRGQLNIHHFVQSSRSKYFFPVFRVFSARAIQPLGFEAVRWFEVRKPCSSSLFLSISIIVWIMCVPSQEKEPCIEMYFLLLSVDRRSLVLVDIQHSYIYSCIIIKIYMIAKTLLRHLLVKSQVWGINLNLIIWSELINQRKSLR